MVIPSILDHKHGKLMKLQYVQGNDLCLCQDVGGSFLKQVNIFFPLCWKASLWKVDAYGKRSKEKKGHK